MHVMHVIDSLNVGGAERMLIDIANATRSDGHAISVCVTRDGRTLAGDLHPAIPLHILGRQRRFDMAAIRQFASLTKDIDVLHAHGRSTFSFLAFVRSLRLIDTPIILHDHFGEIELDTTVPLWFRLYGRRFLDQYVGVSQNLADWACQAGVDPSRVQVIGNALDLDRMHRFAGHDLRADLGVREDALVGIVVCGLRREKGVHVLLNALQKCRTRDRIQILVVGGERGPAYAAECRAQVTTMGMDDLVMFIGERPDALSLIQGADFAVIPSLSESGPLVLIEYMARGLPVVASRTGDIARRADSCGLEGLVDPGDPEALAAEIEKLTLSSCDERRQRGAAGTKIARENFDIRRTIPRWYDVYAAATGRRGR